MPQYTGSFNINFRNEHTIYENFVKCTVEESEYNLSYNPTLLSDRTNVSSSLTSFATGSNFRPYVTTLGLYNEQNELLMVAKFGKPIPISSETDMTFLVKYDT
jgi:hypothetical protein